MVGSVTPTTLTLVVVLTFASIAELAIDTSSVLANFALFAANTSTGISLPDAFSSHTATAQTLYIAVALLAVIALIPTDEAIRVAPLVRRTALAGPAPTKKVNNISHKK